MPTILAIESSCDETAVAIVRGNAGERTKVLASLVSSQIDLHREFGGVVPELASRNHSLRLRPLVEQALAAANCTVADLNAVAATSGPGLASSLLIGSSAAKGIALAAGIPYIGVNHLEGHLLSPFIDRSEVPRHLGLIISGGHTLLIGVESAGAYRKFGSTRDDAAGEAYDKVGKMLGLPYPGGPEIEKAAHMGNPAAFDFPRSMLKESHHDFSFSGMKTAVLYTLQKLESPYPVADLAASFQQAVVEILTGKTLRAARTLGYDTVAVSGGVSMNRAVRQSFERECAESGIEFAIADADFCTDNAAMIGFAGLLRHVSGESTPLETDIHPNLPLV